MNPNLCRVALRPRGPLEVFDLTLRLLRERSRPFAWLAVYTLVPAVALVLVVHWLSVGDWTLGAVAVLVMAPLIQAPFTILGGRLLFEEDASAWEALKTTVKVAGGLAAALFVQAFSLVLICGGIGLVAQPVVLYLTETALLERVPLSRGVRRSSRLATGQLGIAVVGVLAAWGLTAWGALLGELTGQALIGFVLQLGQPFGALEQGVATPYLIIGALAIQPVIAVYRLMLYVDVRTRMEGWDLQVGLRAVGLGTER